MISYDINTRGVFKSKSTKFAEQTKGNVHEQKTLGP